MKYWYMFEKRVHEIDAYLAYNRGNMVLYADSLSRASECERLLLKLEINK